jgi:hypothetical protein
MRILLAATCLIAVLSFACGGGESEADRVESVIRTYIEHYVDSEPAAMYALLDAASRQKCEEANFVAFISAARLALGQRDFEIIEIHDIVIEGDQASAIVEAEVDGEAADATENTLIKEGSDWKLVLPSTVC